MEENFIFIFSNHFFIIGVIIKFIPMGLCDFMAIKKRVRYIDQLRALAIIFVLFAHISTHTCKLLGGIYQIGSLKWASSALLVDFGVIGVPLFLMITGALLLNRDYGDLPSFLKHRFLRILPAFLFWALIFMHQVFTFWYVWLMMGIYLFLPIINSFIKEYGLKGAEYFLIVWFITILMNTFGYYPLYELELSYFFGYIGYVVLGYYLFNKDFKISHGKLLIISFLLFLICTLFGMHYTFYESQIAGKQLWMTYLEIAVVLQGVGVFLFFKNLEDYGGNNKLLAFSKKIRLNKVVDSLSFCSYGMYLDHHIILDPILGLALVQELYALNPLYWMILAVFLIPFLSWIIVYVMSKIPYLKYFSGAY